MVKNNPAYETPASAPVQHNSTNTLALGHPLIPTPLCDQGQLSGVDAIVNGTNSSNFRSVPPAPSGESEAVTRNARTHAEALRRATARNK